MQKARRVSQGLQKEHTEGTDLALHLTLAAVVTVALVSITSDISQVIHPDRNQSGWLSVLAVPFVVHGARLD